MIIYHHTYHVVQSAAVGDLLTALHNAKSPTKRGRSEPYCRRFLELDQSFADSTLYITNGALVLLYVDDTSVFGTSDPSSKDAGAVASRIMTALKSEYKMSDLGLIRIFLGMDIRYTENGLALDQETYIDTMVRKYNLQDARRCYLPLDPKVRLESGECEDRPANKQIYQSMI